MIVSRKTCATVADQLQLQEVVIVGKGIGAKDSIPRSILSNAFESIVAALYLDGGYEVAQPLILTFLGMPCWKYLMAFRLITSLISAGSTGIQADPRLSVAG